VPTLCSMMVHSRSCGLQRSVDTERGLDSDANVVRLTVQTLSTVRNSSKSVLSLANGNGRLYPQQVMRCSGFDH
jgi:hypothetical protein